ncbi:MAG: leucine-rich repeat protein [Anaerolineaceae bacterium]|nr:leucine-rich repeat protein [Anaerolineaceae bacterium]
MKKFICICLFLFLAAVSVLSVHAEILEKDNFRFEVQPDGNIQITRYLGTDNVLIIPDEIDEKPITSIGENAFSNNTSLEVVIIPSGVTVLGSHSFSECTSLRSIVLPSGLQSMGDLVFQGDVLLEKVPLPASLVHIGMNPFDRCDLIDTVSFSGDNNYYFTEDGVLFDKAGNALMSYPAGKKDETYTVPDWVTKISMAAFSENKYLTSVSLSENITSMEGNPFCGCTSLTRLNVSPFNSVFESHKEALFNIKTREIVVYYWGTENESYTVPSGVRAIAQECFYKHPELKSISLPSGLSSIGDAAFAESGLTSITIPDNVISLGNSSFTGCKDLKKIKFPSGLTWIGNYVFSNCTSLESLSFPRTLNSIGEGAFYGCTALTEVVFPESLHFIDSYAFLDCTAIKSVSFPAHLYVIGRAVFYGQEDLTVLVEPGSLAEEWAIQNNIPYDLKNVTYINTESI